jgi:hypothetical protein
LIVKGHQPGQAAQPNQNLYGKAEGMQQRNEMKAYQGQT